MKTNQQDLYIKYRPASFEMMYPTSPLVKSVRGMIDNTLAGKPGGLPKVILLEANEPGVGKTTMARLIACALNPDEPAEEHEMVMQGNRRVTWCIQKNVAELNKKDDGRILGNEMLNLENPLIPYRYVFILDEIHQFTDDAKETLLAPLENIPENVYFIGTTTELGLICKNKSGKVSREGKAFLSRFQKFNFSTLTEQQSVDLCTGISDNEELSIEKRVFSELHAVGEGRPRDVVQGLQYYIQNGKVPEGLINADEKESSYSSELFNLYTKLAATGNGSWYADFRPLIGKMLDAMSPDAARVDMMLSLMRRLTTWDLSKGFAVDKRATASIMELLGCLSDIFDEEISYPQKSVFYARCMRAHSAAHTIYQNSIPKNDTA